LTKINAALEHWDELIWWISFMIPKDIVVLWSSFLTFTSLISSEVENVVFAVVDHLVSDLYKEPGHSFIGVVVSGNGVDHLDTVHESWKSLFNSFGISIIEWLDELLKSLKVLNVILGFVESLSNSKFNASPLGSCEVNLISWLT
jgi:hypothetical protein